VFILGLVLLVLAVLFAIGVVASSQGEDLQLFGQVFDIPSAGGLFLAGVITAAVAGLGLALMLMGLARARKKHAEKKALKRSGHRAETLEEENARLRAQLTAAGPSGSTASGSDRAVYPEGGTRRDQHARVTERQHRV
jgi:cell shape-determining protein MreC